MARNDTYLLILLTLLAGGCHAARRDSATALVAAPSTPSRAKPTSDGKSASASDIQQASFRQPSGQAPAAETIPPGPSSKQPPEACESVRLDLLGAIEVGLANNPDMVSLRQAEGVSLGALGVARTYPINPWVQFQVTPGQHQEDGGSGAVAHYVLLMQTLQLAHQQSFREEAALASLTSVRWNILQAELLNVAQTQRLFFTALYLRGIRDLTRTNAAMNDELLTLSQRQLDAGQISGADAAIVRLDRQATRRQAQLAEANYETALLDLRRQLALPISTPVDLSGDLADWQWVPSDAPPRLPGRELELTAIPELEGAARLASTRPDVMAARADLAAARAGADLARANRRPDLQIGPFYQRSDTGTEYYGFRSQIDLPVINNGTPMVRQRQAEVRQRYIAWEQIHARATLEAEAAIARYERARRILSDASGDATLIFPKEIQRLEAQFKAGEVDVVRIFTARTSLLQARRAQLDALNEMAQSAAAMTAATGLPPQALLESKPPRPQW